MKKLLVATLLAALAMSLQPAGAKTISKRLTFEAAIPCAVAACSYWLPHEESPGTFAVLPYAAGTQISGTDTDLDGTRPPLVERDDDAAYEKQSAYACTKPTVEGTYDDAVVTVPSRVRLMKVSYTPGLDWDMFLCAKPRTGNNGRMIANEDVSFSGCADYVETLDYGSLGCPSSVIARVKPGQKIVIRAYNFSDVDPLSATLRWYT